MSGHHPCSELTEHFTPEDHKVVEAGAAEIVIDIDRRERQQERFTRPADTSRHGGAWAPQAQDPVHLRPDE